MKRIKRSIVLGLSVLVGLGVLSYPSRAREVNSVIENCEELINDARVLFEKHYNPSELGYESFSNPQIYSAKKLSHTEIETDDYLTSENEEIYYWQYSIENLYLDLENDAKEALYEISLSEESFDLAYSILTGSRNLYTETVIEEENDINTITDEDVDTASLRNKALKVNTQIKRLIGAGTASIAFATISSMVSGINASSFIPFVGWIVAAALIAILVIYIVANWSYVKEGFDNFVTSLKQTYKRIASLLTSASNEAKEEAKDNPDVAEDATSTNQMKQQVNRGQAPKGVKRVDDAHTSNGQPHVHFDDDTSLNRDGSIHDKKNGRPNPSRAIWDWLHSNGWCQNGIK